MPSSAPFRPNAARSRPLLAAIGLILVTYALFACLDTLAKFLGQTVAPIQVVWFRFMTHLVLAILIFRPWRATAMLRPNRPAMQLCRGLLLLATTSLNFLSLQYLQLDQTTAIFFLTPFIVAALAGPFLDEWAGPRRWAAILVGFAGALVIVRPGLSGFHPAMLLSLGSAVTYAVYLLLTRRLAPSETAQSMIILPALVAALAIAPVALAQWRPVPGAFEWALLVGTGVLGGLGHWLLIKAYERAPTPVLAPFQYTQIIWMALFGFAVFADVPDQATIAGVLIITASGLYLLSREYGLNRERNAS